MPSEEVINNADKANVLDKGTRLHRFSPLFTLVEVVKRTIIPLVFGVLTYEKSVKVQIAIISIVSFISLFSILQYWFYHYWIKEDKIEIKEGIFFKKNRKVPYTRIQNVNVLQNPLHRLLKLATLQLESASGGKPEAVMRVVSLDVVEQIKEKVRRSSASDFQHKSCQEEALEEQGTQKESLSDKPLLELPVKDVVKYGIISQKGLFFGAILFGFLAQNQKLVAYVFTHLDALYKIPDFAKISLALGIIYVGVVGLVMLVSLQLLSILWALLKFYGFKIEKQKDRLQARMGLISKISATIPLKRIQLYRISENPLHKFFKSRTITVETAGGVNTDNSGIVMRWIAPLIPRVQVKDFMQEIEPEIKLAAVEWQLIPYRAWRRVMKRMLLSLALFSAILTAIALLPQVEIQFYAWIVVLMLIPVIYLYSKNYVKKTGYYIDDDIICFKSGVWFGKQSFVKINKIQTVEILDSPFDRRNKMATLEIDTAGSNILLHHVKIPYLEVAEAYRLRDFIQKKLNASAYSW